MDNIKPLLDTEDEILFHQSVGATHTALVETNNSFRVIVDEDSNVTTLTGKIIDLYRVSDESFTPSLLGRLLGKPHTKEITIQTQEDSFTFELPVGTHDDFQSLLESQLAKNDE